MFLEPVPDSVWETISLERGCEAILGGVVGAEIRDIVSRDEYRSTLCQIARLGFLDDGWLLKMTDTGVLPGPHDSYCVLQGATKVLHVPREPFPHRKFRFSLSASTVCEYARFCAELYWPDGWPIRVVDSVASLQRKLLVDVASLQERDIELSPLTGSFCGESKRYECEFYGLQEVSLRRFRFSTRADGRYELVLLESVARGLPTLDSVEIY